MNRYLCVGGPHDGEFLTDEESGKDYTRFNSSIGQMYQKVYMDFGNQYGLQRIKIDRKKTQKRFNIEPEVWVPGSILLYCPEPKPISLNKKDYPQA